MCVYGCGCCNTRADIQGIYITRREGENRVLLPMRTGSLSITTVDATVTMREHVLVIGSALHIYTLTLVCVSSVTYPNRRSHVRTRLNPTSLFILVPKTVIKHLIYLSFAVILYYITENKHYRQEQLINSHRHP